MRRSCSLSEFLAYAYVTSFSFHSLIRFSFRSFSLYAFELMITIGIETGVKYEEVRGEARQGVGMMNLLSSVPKQKPFRTMSALLEAEEDLYHVMIYMFLSPLDNQLLWGPRSLQVLLMLLSVIAVSWMLFRK
ncbi:hypothetical protein V8G54_004497 [Vigna mungo]|uniref:Uncharacterized protein n=1 Tax=Vigna mungo TaxID=3915 RepID=A0AAQ3SE90_VIGMU